VSRRAALVVEVAVYRDPHAAPGGSRYRSREVLRPPATISPLGAPGAIIPVAQSLPPTPARA